MLLFCCHTRIEVQASTGNDRLIQSDNSPANILANLNCFLRLGSYFRSLMESKSTLRSGIGKYPDIYYSALRNVWITSLGCHRTVQNISNTSAALTTPTGYLWFRINGMMAQPWLLFQVIPSFLFTLMWFNVKMSSLFHLLGLQPCSYSLHTLPFSHSATCKNVKSSC